MLSHMRSCAILHRDARPVWEIPLPRENRVFPDTRVYRCTEPAVRARRSPRGGRRHTVDRSSSPERTIFLFAGLTFAFPFTEVSDENNRVAGETRCIGKMICIPPRRSIIYNILGGSVTGNSVFLRQSLLTERVARGRKYCTLVGKHFSLAKCSFYTVQNVYVLILVSLDFGKSLDRVSRKIKLTCVPRCTFCARSERCQSIEIYNRRDRNTFVRNIFCLPVRIFNRIGWI